ncbi:MAG: amino acid adenylation domain-containing protein [Allomuricauda sp.]
MGETVLKLFYKNASAKHNETALIYGDRRVSFHELDSKSNRLAHYLKKYGVRGNVIVPVILNQDDTAIMAMLGILKAGGAFSPIEPGTPLERISGILEDIQPIVIITCSNLYGQIPPEKKNICILLDKDASSIKEELTARLPFLPIEKDLAYVIFTSGSTGNPKGVMVEHRQLFAYLNDVYGELNLNRCNSYAVLGSFAADAGYTAIFTALCYGKTLNIINLKNISRFELLIKQIKKHKIDCYKITPTLLAFLLKDTSATNILPRKRLIIGGEACPGSLMDLVLTKVPRKCEVFNHYGPTETTIGVSTFKISKDVEWSSKNIPIGKPLPNVNIHILDKDLNEVTGGEDGELYISGSLLARGYLNNPKMTKEKFIFVKMNGKVRRLYRTGDIVRLLGDGNIQFIGRSDGQIKIAGRRIELGDIENNISQCDMVRQCVVVIGENQLHSKCVIAYIEPQKKYDKHLFQQFLTNKIPVYLHPNLIFLIDKWPLTFNNKIDRKLLTKPERFNADDASYYSSNNQLSIESTLHQELLKIWKRLLQIDHITYHDHFFELGGNSLLLIRMSFEISNALDIDLVAEELFSAMTINELCRYIESKKNVIDSVEVTPTRIGEQGASKTQKKLFVQNLLNGDETFPRSNLTLEISGKMDFLRLENAFSKIIMENESLRTHFFLNSGNVFIKVSNDFKFKINRVKGKTNSIDEEIFTLTGPFDFTKDLLVRVYIIELKNSKKYLHMDLPHINSDGWSLNVMMQDLEEVYNQKPNGGKKYQFSDFQNINQSYMASNQYQVDKLFWENLYSHENESFKISSSRNIESLQSRKLSGVSIVIGISAEKMMALDQFAKKRKSTRFQILLVTYFIFLAKLNLSKKISIMIPVHNRRNKISEKIIGLITNAIIFKMDIDDELSIDDFLKSFEHEILKVIKHSRYPIEDLFEFWIKKGRKVNNLISSFFGYLNYKERYSFGDATMRLHVPLKNMENLPMSLAVFDNESSLTLRLSSNIGYFNYHNLNKLGKNYLNLLSALIEANSNQSLKDVLNMELNSLTIK